MAESRRGWNLRGPRKAVLSGSDNPAWKGDRALTTTKRARAQRLFVLGKCERCESPATDRHHIDGNTGNNIPANIAALCRRCHMTVDGRITQYRKNLKPRQQKNPLCSNCGQPYKPMRRGRCAACAAFFKRNGSERKSSSPKKHFGERAE